MMLRDEGPSEADSAGTTTGFSVDRRSYLKLAGITAGAATLFSGPASASFSRRGIEFKHTVDMVADAGCDPTGTEPCDQQIQDAADDFTLLKFPEGEYKLTERNFIYNKTNVGFLGVGDVRFSVPERFNEKLLVVDSGTGVLFEGIDIDLRANGATPGLHLGVDDNLEVHDVEFIGQGIHPDSDPRGEGNGNPFVTNAFYPIVRSPDGTGTVRNLVAKNAGLMGAYNHGDGRTGVWIGMQNKGTVTLSDCQIEGFPNNATYCSRTPGTVQIEGGRFRNNDISQIRISSRDSYADGASVQADFNASDSPNPDDTLNARGVRFEAGPYGYGGAVIRDCDIGILSVPNSSGGVVVGSDGADHTIYDSRISVNEDGVRGVYIYPPTGYGDRSPPPKPHKFEMHNISITGEAAGNEAVQIRDRPNSMIEDCCIQQTGPNRNGIVLKDSDNNTIANTTINVTGDEIISRNCDPRTYGISTTGSCQTPSYDGGDALPHVLSITTVNGRASYTFSVSGDLEKSTANGASIDDNDIISGSTAIGQGGDGGIDSYAFSGSLESFDLDGEANITLDGEPAHVGQRPDHVLTITGGESRFSYTFSVSDDLEKSTANGASIDDNDIISGNTATGQGGDGGIDSYTFSGSLESFDLDGEANITVDGKSAHVGHRPDHTLVIDGAGSRADYSFSVSGDIAASGSLTGEDSITGSSATGAVGGGRDRYRFTGELVAFSLDGEANITVDGEPAHVGHIPDHVLAIDGAGSRADYSFSVSGDVATSSSLTGEDSITGSSVTGAVGSGRDWYGFTGELVTFSLDGEANITVDGEPAHVGYIPDHVLVIDGAGSRADYSFSVSGDIADSGSLTGEDSITGSSATGAVGGGRDRYRFTGELVTFSLDGEANITVDGEPAHVGHQPDHTLVIDGAGSRADYSFSVSGDIADSGSLTGEDSITGSSVTGAVGGGRDRYRFTGELVTFSLDGKANITVDGEPAHVGHIPDTR